MIEFFKRLFHIRNKKRYPEYIGSNPELDFDNTLQTSKKPRKHPDADVHKLMIEATRIRKTKGYPAAIKYLRDFAEYYLEEQNTALITCMNKLIPYMKRGTIQDNDEIKKYLEGIISRAPTKTEPYFLNLHITMANLFRSYDIEEATTYLKNTLEKHGYTIDTYNIQIHLTDLLSENHKTTEAKASLLHAKTLLNDKLERFKLIKMQRKWHRSYAYLNLFLDNSNNKVNYLFHRFVEFALDMARVLNPIHIDQFHERKDMYYKKERGFVDTESYNKVIQELDLEQRKDSLLKEIYGFCFEEMPAILGVSERQLHYQPGDQESLEELRQKKIFHRKPFKELPVLEDKINHIVQKYIK